MPILSRRGFGGALLAAAAALSLATGPAAADGPEVVRIGSTAPGHMKFVVFRHRDTLTKALAKKGVRVEFLTFDGGSAASVALGSGQLELMYTGNNPALRLAASGADVKAVGLSSWVPNNETVVLVRPDSPIHRLEDLKGKRVAYLTGTVRHSIFSKALRSVGLSTDDVESFNLGIENSGPALARGDIDALVESSGVARKLVEAGVAREVFDAAGHPEWAVPYIITANGEFARRHPDVLTTILAEDIRLARSLDENPEETIRTFVAETGNAEASVRETYGDGKFHQDPEITPEAVVALRGEEAFMKENGLLKGSVDYDTWIDRSFYDKARAATQQASK